MSKNDKNNIIYNINADQLAGNVRAFADYEADFYHYMILYGNLVPKTSRDYISRLRFLSQSYLLDENISEEYIDYIIETERRIMSNRQRYVTPKAMSDFRSGLKKFLAFIKSAYYQDSAKRIENEVHKVEMDDALTITERTSIIQSRVGQGTFRSSLIRYWHGCSISCCSLSPILIASHIKPWCDCCNTERLDLYNGLLLLPNYDKLFDKGYISFNTNGKLISSRLLDKDVKEILGITDGLSLRKLDDKHKVYLKYHNECCFMR